MNKNFIVKHTYFVGLGVIIFIFLPTFIRGYLGPLLIQNPITTLLFEDTFSVTIYVNDLCKYLSLAFATIGMVFITYSVYKLLIYFIKLK